MDGERRIGLGVQILLTGSEAGGGGGSSILRGTIGNGRRLSKVGKAVSQNEGRRTTLAQGGVASQPPGRPRPRAGASGRVPPGTRAASPHIRTSRAGGGQLVPGAVPSQEPPLGSPGWFGLAKSKAGSQAHAHGLGRPPPPPRPQGAVRGARGVASAFSQQAAAEPSSAPGSSPGQQAPDSPPKAARPGREPSPWPVPGGGRAAAPGAHRPAASRTSRSGTSP